MPSIAVNDIANGDGTSRPKVFALNPLRSKALKLAKSRFDLVLPTDSGVEKWQQEADGLLVVGAHVTGDDLDRAAELKRLRFISKQGTGVDKIDISTAKKYGIPVMNTPGVNGQAVAELAFSMIVTLARQTASIDRRIRSGETVTKSAGWTGQLLFGKTLGVVGGGNIGLLVAKMFHGAFSGDVILYDPYLRSLEAWHSVIPPSRVRLVTELNDLLADSDIVTIHVPLTASTLDMISAEQFKIMKKTAILINTARGGIVNETDLAQALENEEIFAAGLDAFTTEPPTLSQYPELCASDRVLLLPHIGAATESVQEATCLAMVQNLVDAFDGKVQNRVC